MNVISTRGGVAPISLDVAIARGLAADGGLFVPEALPRLEIAAFDGVDDLAGVTTRLLAPLFAGSTLQSELERICREALTFPVPLVALDAGTSLLELFHGPTAAFKDVGARFLAACLARLGADGNRGTRTVLVATSGDTGSAVADAFHGREGFAVAVLYPDGRVSPRQAHLLGCYGDNVRAFAVRGTFDDCQRLAKGAFADAELAGTLSLTSANSISLGRLLPQMGYYAQSALAHYRAHGNPLHYAIPTGNLGNALACVLARRMGLPIGDIVLATNANQVLPEYFAGGDYAPRDGIATLANAMDVGAPSNFERLRHWFDDASLRRELRAAWASDDAIRAAIAACHARTGRAICPHTATAWHVLDGLRNQGDDRAWCIVATAHPAKFDTVVEPIVGAPVPPPPPLARLLARNAHAEALPSDAEALRAALLRR